MNYNCKYKQSWVLKIHSWCWWFVALKSINLIKAFDWSYPMRMPISFYIYICDTNNVMWYFDSQIKMCVEIRNEFFSFISMHLAFGWEKIRCCVRYLIYINACTTRVCKGDQKENTEQTMKTKIKIHWNRETLSMVFIFIFISFEKSSTIPSSHIHRALCKCLYTHWTYISYVVHSTVCRT